MLQPFVLLKKRFEAIFQVVIKLCAEAYNMHRANIPAEYKTKTVEITTTKAIDFRQSTTKNCANYGKEIYWANLIGTNSFQRKGRERKIYCCGLAFWLEPQIWKFHVVVSQTTSRKYVLMKCCTVLYCCLIQPIIPLNCGEKGRQLWSNFPLRE